MSKSAFALSAIRLIIRSLVENENETHRQTVDSDASFMADTVARETISSTDFGGALCAVDLLDSPSHNNSLGGFNGSFRYLS